MNLTNNTHKVLVAIKCLTYNHEPYIRDALEGFVMQKTNFRFVAIVHDDASTDGTAKIIREYAEKYPDIIKPIFETENQYSKKDGTLTKIVSKALEATGAKYIAMCEGDDYWTDPLKLQKQIDFLETHPEFSLCCSEVNYLNQETGEIKLWALSSREVISFDNLLTEGNQISTLSVVCKADGLGKYNKTKHPIWPVGDYPMWLYMTEEAPAYKISDITATYRVLPESASHIKDVKKQFLFALSLREVQLYYASKHNLSTFRYRLSRMKLIIKYSILSPKYTPFFISHVLKLTYKLSV